MIASIRHLSILAVVAAFSSVVQADVLFVDDDASAGGDGLSWSTAYRFLQDALSAAAASGGIVAEVRVAQGIYLPDRDEANPDPGLTNCCDPHEEGGCDNADCESLVCATAPSCCNNEWGEGCARTAANICTDVNCPDELATFQLVSGVSVLGGFAGVVAANPDERSIEQYETILSGDLLGNDGPNLVNNADNCRHVVWSAHAGSTTVLDGFTIAAGNANGPTNNADAFGGGIIVLDSELLVSGCTFIGNAAARNGGGIYAGAQADLTVVACTFSANRASSTGLCNSGGGAIAAFEANALLVDCQLHDNQGCLGGAVNVANFGAYLGSLTMKNCLMSGNAALAGGAVFSQDTPFALTNCTIIGNVVSAGAFGGGFGGAIFDQQGYQDEPEPIQSMLVNCVLSENSTDNLGGAVLHVTTGTMTLVNCTIGGNSAAEAGGGFVVGTEGANVSMRNCVLWDNVDANGNGEASQILIYEGEGQVELNYSCVQGLTGNLGGTANIGEDPLFADPTDSDYRLSPGSPCIDAGHNNAIAGLTNTDLGGNPRFADDPDTVDTGCGVPVVVDMGAYEFEGKPATVLFGDVNGDGRVGVGDLAALIQCMGSPDPACCVADLDLDGEVGMSDVMLLIHKLVHSVSFGL